MNNDFQPFEAPFFAPQLILNDVLAGMEFYKAAFGAIELRRWSNPDGSVHVAEMAIGRAMFHLHEEMPGSGESSPATLKGTTFLMGLFVDDPASVMKQAVAAGAQEAKAVQDYDYGYRQGTVIDPGGHHWLIQKKL
ncbi:MAG TPA: VOC family protein [Verrucomicrobiae bacterium]|jgi:PhnB protein